MSIRPIHLVYGLPDCSRIAPCYLFYPWYPDFISWDIDLSFCGQFLIVHSPSCVSTLIQDRFCYQAEDLSLKLFNASGCWLVPRCCSCILELTFSIVDSYIEIFRGHDPFEGKKKDFVWACYTLVYFWLLIIHCLVMGTIFFDPDPTFRMEFLGNSNSWFHILLHVYFHQCDFHFI